MMARKRWLWPVMMLGIVTLGACGGGGGSSEPSTSFDAAPPVFSSMSPPQGAVNVALNQSITVTFNESLKCATATVETVTLSRGATVIPGAVSCAGANVTFTPTDLMAPESLHTIVITSIADLSGNALVSPVSKSFTTGLVADSTAPTVIDSAPANNATGVGLDSIITASFSEAINPASVKAANFTLKAGSTTIAGTVSYSGTNFAATFQPSEQLAVNTVYTASLTTGIADLAGNTLATAYSWSFTTEATDSAPPLVTATVPAANDAFVNSQAPIKAVFNEKLDPATINGGTFTLASGGAAVAGTVSLEADGVTVVFTPDAPLAAGTPGTTGTSGTVYTATLGSAIADLAGTPRTAAHSWNFTVSVPGLTASPTFSRGSATAGEQVQMTLPVTPNAYNITVCVVPNLAVQTQIAKASVDAGGCETITNAAGATSIPVTVNIPTDAIEADYYPSLVLTENGTDAPLRSRYELSALSATRYTVSTQSGTADDYVANIAIPFLVVGPAADLQVTISSVTRTDTNLAIAYTVRNAGARGAGAFSVDFFVNPATTPVVGATGALRIGLTSLAAGATFSDTAVLSGIGSDPSLIMALTDSAGVVPESNENNNLGIWAALDTPLATRASTDVPLVIPSASSVSSTLAVSGISNPLRYLAVDLGVTHAFVSDLVITLVSPSGTAVVLSNQRGGNGANFTGTIFHDGAPTAISAGNAPFTGQFRPEAPLIGLAGEDGNGLWILRIEDIDPLDSGVLNSWTLRLW